MQFDQLNYLAVDMLERFGNTAPSQEQIDLMESLLKNVVLHKRLIYDDRLNKDEIACINLAASGKSSKETAILLKMEQARIELHRKNIKRKLGCSNMAQVIFEGIRFGYVTPRFEDASKDVLRI